jgi:hypothetical protein
VVHQAFAAGLDRVFTVSGVCALGAAVLVAVWVRSAPRGGRPGPGERGRRGVLRRAKGPSARVDRAKGPFGQINAGSGGSGEGRPRSIYSTEGALRSEPGRRLYAPDAASTFARVDFTSAKLGLVAADPSG